MTEDKITELPLPYFVRRSADDAAPETITLAFPDHLEDFLFTMPVLNAHRGWLMTLNRKARYHIWCRPEFIPLVVPVISGSTTPPYNKTRYLGPDVRFITGMDDEARASDLVLEFDHRTAYDLSITNRRHAVETYGMILGSAPDARVPIYGRFPVSDLPLVLYLPRHVTDYRSDVEWPCMFDLQKAVEGVTPLKCRILSPKTSVKFAYEAISSAALCVGMCGGLTAFAASLGRPLLEIYPNNLFHEQWAVKWSNQGQPTAAAYSTVCNDPAKVPMEMVLRTLGRMLNEVMKGKPVWAAPRIPFKAIADSTMTAPSTSAAPIVESRS